MISILRTYLPNVICAGRRERQSGNSVKWILASAVVFAAAFCFPAIVRGETSDSNDSFLSNIPIETHGFYELRAGYRLGSDKYEKDMSIMETRLQLDLSSSYLEWADLKFKGDVLGDLVTEEVDFDTREAYIFTMPADFMDLKVGRQILTWGTGDLVFINDLFPKDWQSFFIGRDTEYLKAPSDAVKASFFSDLANLDIVYTPQFDPDRFISGKRISYWNSNLGRLAGRDAIQRVEKPDRWFHDDEIAVRLYKNINSYELAVYGYHGYWKSPGGQNAAATRAIFPDLNVYGASLRGNVGKGIGNLEFGYYDSSDDRNGKNGLVNNSELRFLAGYTQEIGKDFTAAVQYYVEHMLEYNRYKNSSPVGLSRDRDRHLVTLRLTKLLMNQNLRCSLFTYFSPSDKDVYMRPNVNYKVSDNLAIEAGANVFFGSYRSSFFGEFENNTNIYTALRYSF
ncbi:MAG: hypothetical protein PHY02_05860 [Phycisphaerae bacterium]|nr:hypothetical protein [Phycisphaerae bacterium]